MGSEEPAKTGYLHVLHQGFLKKSWLHKYCALYDSGRHGVKRLEVYDSEEGFSRHAQQKCITLGDCIKVVPALQKQQPNVFEVHTRTQSQHFSADSFGEMTEWIEAIRGVTFGQQAVATSAAQDSPTLEEENTLYGSLDAPHVFRVHALPTEAAERCGLRGSFFLLVGPRGVTLAERGPRGALGAALLWWPYNSIRRYGLLAAPSRSRLDARRPPARACSAGTPPMPRTSSERSPRACAPRSTARRSSNSWSSTATRTCLWALGGTLKTCSTCAVTAPSTLWCRRPLRKSYSRSEERPLLVFHSGARELGQHTPRKVA
ncbi:hypothetical protein HPB51_013986 [Rhipicephalus microplus]|uniref:PH domain-containing protein n=1 Tax=Rhipicephalus microplus TaxID=6941 RepID=A0A9J6DA56_RHIMP|nr:hypothetical protein HPB51_013986 [Rhipicephalus microplus]